MNLAALRRFAPLYQTARYLGADLILRRHLGLPADYPLPLGLSHGVDFGQMHRIMDAHGIEPIYWAYNEGLLAKAASVKLAIGIPHPFLLATSGRKIPAGRGTLVIGPPPGPRHDRDLLDRLGRGGDHTILVKPKQNYAASVAFWRDHGFPVVTFADEGPPSYEGMAALLSRYERVAGCTFSSVLLFAAALGKTVDLIRGHRCRVYEVANIEQSFDFGSREAAEVCRTFAGGDPAAVTDLSRRLLGSGFDSAPEALADQLDRAIGMLSEPLYFATRYPKPVRRLMAELALRTGRPGLVMRSFPDLLRGSVAPRVVVQDLDELDLWLSGRTPDNPRLVSVPYVPGRTIPGDAVDPY
jgi:hypothetical protein